MTHPNTLSSFKDDVNRISVWKNMFNGDYHFKLEFKEDFLSQHMFQFLDEN